MFRDESNLHLIIRSPEVANLLREMMNLIPPEKQTRELIQRVWFWRDRVFNPPYPILIVPEDDIVITLSSDGRLESCCPLHAVVLPVEGTEIAEAVGAVVSSGSDVVDLPAEVCL